MWVIWLFGSDEFGRPSIAFFSLFSAFEKELELALGQAFSLPDVCKTAIFQSFHPDIKTRSVPMKGLAPRSCLWIGTEDFAFEWTLVTNKGEKAVVGFSHIDRLRKDVNRALEIGEHHIPSN